MPPFADCLATVDLSMEGFLGKLEWKEIALNKVTSAEKVKTL